MKRFLLAASALCALAAPGLAQNSGSDTPIVVTGMRDATGREIPMSDWRVAETDHVLVYSKGDRKQLVRVAHNLEKLHFLLSMLLNRVGEPDGTLKLRVTLIGDEADFSNLDLYNLRWQHGPYPRAFPVQLYYDPREDGPVLATTQKDQTILLKMGRRLDSISNLEPNGMGGMGQSMGGPGGAVAQIMVGEESVPWTAAGRLYSGFAQHYLLTYFPAAYPRWYLEGFGEVFATLAADQDGVIEYGRAPEGFRKVIEWYGQYKLADVFAGDYLEEPGRRPDWTPFHAWALVHMLFFSDAWKEPLHRYLAAVARGENPQRAARALGDVNKLQREFAAYRGSKVPYEVMTYPASLAAEPVVRQLRKSEATLVRGRLELGARVELPPAPPPRADARTAERMNDERRRAIARRDAWLGKLRENAAFYVGDPEVQLLLAEAECRTGNDQGCLTAADRTLALLPDNPAALSWKGVALARLAAAGPADRRDAELKAARALIVRANRLDTEATLPLIAYYRSFADAGLPAPDVAVDGLAKASESVPAAPTTRLLLGTELARRGDRRGARKVLRPVVDGPYDSPEKPLAQAVLSGR